MIPFAPDKLLHFAFSALIVFTVEPIAAIWLGPIGALCVAVAVSATIGIFKEIVHDHLLDLGQLEVGDFIANGIGIAYATGVLALL